MPAMKNFFTRIATVLAVFASACDNENLPDFMKSSGAQVSDTVVVKSYKDLIVNNNFRIELVKDTRDFIVVEYGENLIQNVSVKYDEASASVSVLDDTKFGMVRNNQAVPKLKCHFSLLCNIFAHSSVIVSSDDSIDVRQYVFDGFVGGLDVVSNSPEVRLEVAEGSGTYRITGMTDRLEVDARYTSIVDAEGLQARVAHVESHSTGDVRVNASDTVYAGIHHTGDVCYRRGAVPVLVAKKGKGILRIIE